MLQDLRLRAIEREKQKSREIEQNRILLQHALDMEHNRIEMEHAKKHAGKVECIRGDGTTGDEAIEDAMKNHRIDETRKSQSIRLDKIKDDRMAAEADSKRRWMQEVSPSIFLDNE